MSASYLRKYATGTGADIYLNLPKAGSANHAVGADWTPAAGDVKVSIDGGAAANIGTLPTAVAMGNSASWKFVFTNAELTGKFISVTVSDSATKAVDDTGFSIETYGNASALHPFDLATATQTVTVGTNNDKTGYRLSATGVDDIWDEDVVAAHGTADTAGLLLRVLGALISQRTNNATLHALLGVVDAVGRDLPEQVWLETARILTAATNITSTGGTTVPQTGDSFARLGAPAGASVSADIATKATPAQVNTEVLDVLTVDTFAQPGQETPAATTTLGLMLRYLYKAWRNRHTQTATEYGLYADNTTTLDQKATVSDDGTTFDRGEVATGL